MPFIRETIVTTINEDGSIKISPLGIHIIDNELHIKPFKPSTTLDNLIRHKSGVINYVDDVRIFSGCITKKKTDWKTATSRMSKYCISNFLIDLNVCCEIHRSPEIEIPRLASCKNLRHLRR